MERKIVYFEDLKKDNTLETFLVAEARLRELNIKKLVVASTFGDTARKAMEYFKDSDIQLIVVPHQFGFSSPENLFPMELVKELRDHGHEVYFGTMLFHTEKIYATNTPAIIADFLRCFSQGVKVCFEIVLMASDGGFLRPGERVIAIAGTGRGADTAMVMQAATSRNLNKLRVNEILCKPLYEVQ